MINTKDLIKVLEMYEKSNKLFHVECYPSGVFPYVIAIAGICGMNPKELLELIKELKK